MSKLKAGILITTILSVLSLPLSYMRNWLLSQFGEIVVADFAIILMISSVIGTFFLFGASTVYSMYLPKIDEKSKQINFIISSSLISLALLLIGSVLFFCFPVFSMSLMNNDKDISKAIFNIIFFIFVFGIGQLIMYSLIGLQKYKISAYLNFTQPIVVVVFLFLVYFYDAQTILEDSFSILILLISCIWVINSLVGVGSIFHKEKVNYFWFLPNGFWKQAIYVHLGTVLTFLYSYVDQILVLSYLGKKELATYFLTIQVARLVNFISLKLLQVFQSSFASTLKEKTVDGTLKLKKIYNKISRYNLFISFCIAVLLVLFGSDIMSIFSKSMNFNNEYLFFLVLIFFIGSQAGIHSQVIQAKEKNELFFFNNVVIVLIQVFLSLLLVENYGVLGIIFARLISTIWAQFSLAIILNKKCGVNFYSPKIYCTLIFVLISIYYISLYEIYFVIRVPIFLIVTLILMKILKIDIKTIIK